MVEVDRQVAERRGVSCRLPFAVAVSGNGTINAMIL